MRRAGRIAIPVAAAAGMGVAIAGDAPLLAVLGLLPLVLALLVRPERAAVVFAFASYINLPVILVAAFGLPPGAAAAFALLLAVPVVLAVVVGREALVVTPALVLMIAWLVVLVFSSIVAGGATGEGPYAIKAFLTEGLLLTLLVVNAVRTPAMMRAVVWALVLAGGLMGATSVWQELTHSYHQTLLGFAQVNDEAFKVGETLNGKVLRPRLSGPIGEQNRYGQVLLVLVPLAISRVRVERDVRLRWLAAGLGTLILCGMMLSFSRGAAVAFALLVIAMVATGFVALRHVVAIGLALVVLVAALAPDYAMRLQSLGSAQGAIATDGTADASIRGRATENLAALATFRDHPVIGVGPGGFFRKYSQAEANKLNLRFLGKNRRAHNMYLEIAADTGALGLSAFLAIVIVTMVQLSRVARARAAAGFHEQALLAQAFVMVLVAYLAGAIFLQLPYQRYFWLLVALANATIWMLRREAAQDAPDRGTLAFAPPAAPGPLAPAPRLVRS
jgi:putative inorganic carbon (hco3(-)) transporter